EGDIPVMVVTNLRQHLHRCQRGAAQLEEIVANPDTLDPKQLFPSAAEVIFQFGPRRNVMLLGRGGGCLRLDLPANEAWFVSVAGDPCDLGAVGLAPAGRGVGAGWGNWLRCPGVG